MHAGWIDLIFRWVTQIIIIIKYIWGLSMQQDARDVHLVLEIFLVTDFKLH